MEIHRIASRTELKQNKNRIALQYGPMVYCVKGVDNNRQAWNFILPGDASLHLQYIPGLPGGVNTITMMAKIITPGANGQTVQVIIKPIIVIPYFAWNNRDANEMQVWLPTSFHDLKVN